MTLSSSESVYHFLLSLQLLSSSSTLCCHFLHLILVTAGYLVQLDELFEGRDSNYHLSSPLVIHGNNKENTKGSSIQSRNVCEINQYLFPYV